MRTALDNGLQIAVRGKHHNHSPQPEKLLPTVDYAYTDEGETGQFESELPAAFYVSEDCADPLISFECLDYLEASKELFTPISLFS